VKNAITDFCCSSLLEREVRRKADGDRMIVLRYECDRANPKFPLAQAPPSQVTSLFYRFCDKTLE
jgi:hypothetical protein